jgi:hypothetical protein
MDVAGKGLISVKKFILLFDKLKLKKMAHPKQPFER